MERLAEFGLYVLHGLQQLGGIGILLGLMLEVIPSEIVLAYGGYLVARGELGFGEAIAYGTVGGTVAQLLMYALGRYGGRALLERIGRYVHIGPRQLERSEQWFRRYGAGVIFFARFVPLLRHAISIPAGIARMPLGLFTLLTALAVLPWTVLFVYLGMTLGERWQQAGELAGPYIRPAVIVALAFLIGWYIVRLARRKQGAI
ncbi:DedA family protein [Paenibacillus sp. IB182496]|uniref:DedA family protein n=1 Tax=Paenibacillus sabuli TaxID=2772509 RepID=A0A927BSU1_9BACL|nr:DedA family protein [Paenibacillus sabuli]MBD2844894.1 DedA family protein [Paenibacillus sabuli]